MLKAVKQIVPRFITNTYHLAQSQLASALFGHPEKKLKIIGVTGTDGKTTTVNLIYHLLKTSGLKTGLISTVKAVIGDKEYDTGLHVTTPSPIAVKKYLQKMAESSTQWAVVEVTSHALDQNRVSGIDFEIGVVTNITHEHLDYHKTFSKYVLSKAKLVRSSHLSILNKDDPNFDILQSRARGKVLSFGIRQRSDLQATDIHSAPFGTRFKLMPEKKEMRTSLIGTFNVYNCLSAILVARHVGISDEVIQKALKTFPPLPGRMERIEEGQNFTIIVDFAHTPNALEQALQTLRPLNRGHLISVFGSAGERDVDKRPMMGKVAIKNSDLVILTSEDPRSEDPNQIMTEIGSGMVKNGGILNKNFWMIADREAAIKFALTQLARTGDVVGIFGKGHEKSMSIAGTEYPWSDQDQVKKILKERRRK